MPSKKSRPTKSEALEVQRKRLHNMMSTNDIWKELRDLENQAKHEAWRDEWHHRPSIKRKDYRNE